MIPVIFVSHTLAFLYLLLCNLFHYKQLLGYFNKC